MKKLLLLSLISMTILISSCKKEKEIDYTKPENLVGTTWKYTDTDISTTLEYLLLKFTTTTQFQARQKDTGGAEYISKEGSFTIIGNNINLEGTNGTINGNTMSIVLGSKTVIFTKQ